MHNQPWALAPELKKEHLQQLANLLVQVRGEVIDRHEPELGDTRLSLGIRAYECCRSRIIFKDEEAEWSWLSILTENGRFTFAIDGVPVRFSRNDPSCLPERKLILSTEAQMQLALSENEQLSSAVRWFFVIDTPYDVPVEKAFVVGYSESNEIVCKWEIPLADLVPVVSSVDKDKPKAVVIPPAKAKLKLVKKKDDVDKNGE
jgi:hypothetical protein